MPIGFICGRVRFVVTREKARPSLESVSVMPLIELAETIANLIRVKTRPGQGPDRFHRGRALVSNEAQANPPPALHFERPNQAPERHDVPLMYDIDAL